MYDVTLPDPNFKLYILIQGQYHHEEAPGNNHYPGVAHADELYLQWAHMDNVEHPLNQEDSEISLRLTTMWTNFVKYGNPTPPEQDLGFTWNPVTPESKE